VSHHLQLHGNFFFGISVKWERKSPLATYIVSFDLDQLQNEKKGEKTASPLLVCLKNG
jgi:hypothetical protein